MNCYDRELTVRQLVKIKYRKECEAYGVIKELHSFFMHMPPKNAVGSLCFLVKMIIDTAVYECIQ